MAWSLVCIGTMAQSVLLIDAYNEPCQAPGNLHGVSKQSDTVVSTSANISLLEVSVRYV